MLINEVLFKKNFPEVTEGQLRRKMLIDLLNGLTDEEIIQIGKLKKKIVTPELYLQGVINYELTVTNNIFDQMFSDN